MNIHTILLAKQLMPNEAEEMRSILFDPRICDPGVTYRDKKTSNVISNVFKDHGIKIIMTKIKDDNGYFHEMMYLKMNLFNVIAKKKSRIHTFQLGRKNIEKLEKRFSRLFSIFPDGFSSLNDYYITRLDLCCDIQMEEHRRRTYLKIANGCLLPNKAEKILWYDETGKKNRPSSHRVEYSFPSYHVVIYDKQKQLENSNIDDLDSSESEDILRFELAINKQGLRNLSKRLFGEYRVTDVPPVSLLYALHYSGMDGILFLNGFEKVFFSGDYYPLKMIRSVVLASPMKDKTKVKLVEITELTAMHRSIEKAVEIYSLKHSDQDVLYDDVKYRRKTTDALKKLDSFGVNPFPLPARYAGDSLKSIPHLLESALKKRKS